MKRQWHREPSDGTNYRHWKSDDGFIIETKPRFRAAMVMPYTLYLPTRLRRKDSYGVVVFQTLALAKAAADWPDERLVDEAQRHTDRARNIFVPEPVSNAA